MKTTKKTASNATFEDTGRLVASAKRPKPRPTSITVYVVMRGDKVELATSSQNHASSFVEGFNEGFNKVRPANAPEAVIVTRTLEV